jgi:hypothetical protein
MTLRPSLAALLLALFTSTAWTAMRPVEDRSPAGLQAQLKPGDRVRVEVRDGRSFELRLTRVEAESLTGAADSGKQFRIRYSAIERLERDDGAAARSAPAAARSGPNAWVGFNAGLLVGSVELPCGPGSSGDCDEAGVFGSYGLNFTIAGDMALRVRGVRADENTEKEPEEIAAMVGPQVNEGVYVLVGVGRIRNPDNDYSGNASGLAWELLFVPPSRSSLSFEASLQGNHFGDAQYAGISVGIRFGKLGP